MADPFRAYRERFLSEQAQPVTGEVDLAEGASVDLTPGAMVDLVEGAEVTLVAGTEVGLVEGAGVTLVGEIRSQNAHVPPGGSLSNTINLLSGQRYVVAARMPAVWTAASLSFAVSDDDIGANFGPLYYDGEELVILPLAGSAAGCRITFDHRAFVGWPYVRVRSGTSADPVNQAEERVVVLMTRSG